jgi:hypothetical protein
MKEAENRGLEGSLVQRRIRRGRQASWKGSRMRTPNGASLLEHFLKQNASGLTFLGVTLGVFVSRKFLILPLAIGLMLAQDKLGKAGLERAERAIRS